MLTLPAENFAVLAVVEFIADLFSASHGVKSHSFYLTPFCSIDSYKWNMPLVFLLKVFKTWRGKSSDDIDGMHLQFQKVFTLFFPFEYNQHLYLKVPPSVLEPLSSMNIRVCVSIDKNWRLVQKADDTSAQEV